MTTNRFIETLTPEDALLPYWRTMIIAYKSAGQRPGRLPIMLKKRGPPGAFAALVEGDGEGFRKLAAAGLAHASAEAVVLRFAERFPPELVLRAQSRLTSVAV